MKERNENGKCEEWRRSEISGKGKRKIIGRKEAFGKKRRDVYERKALWR